MCLLEVGARRYWRFEGAWFSENEGLTQDEVRALLVTREHQRRAAIQRAQTIAAQSEAPAPVARPRRHPRRYAAPRLVARRRTLPAVWCDN